MDETKGTEMKKGVCSHGDHCCGCNSGKMGMCARHTGGRWLGILVAIFLSFWVGMKLGEIKGFMMAQGFDTRMSERMDHKMRGGMPQADPNAIYAPGMDVGAPDPSAQ